MPVVSVIVPVYNGRSTIEDCLESLLRQQTSFEYEIVVADSSDDGTADVIAERFPTVKLIRLKERAYPGAARNVAIREARADLVAMIDADCVAHPTMLARMVECHRSGTYAAVGGAIRNGTPATWSGFLGYVLEFREFIPRSPRRQVYTIPTANICYRRDVLFNYGLFDNVRASEDMLLNWRIAHGGGRILFDPSIEVTHLNRTGWRKVITYQAVLGASSGHARFRLDPPFPVFRKYPALGWLLPYLVQFPSLAILIPPVRLARALYWLARYDWPSLARLLVLSPAYLVGAFTWSRAFVGAVRDDQRRQRRDANRRAGQPGNTRS